MAGLAQQRGCVKISRVSSHAPEPVRPAEKGPSLVDRQGEKPIPSTSEGPWTCVTLDRQGEKAIASAENGRSRVLEA